MNPETIRSMLMRQPFIPFRICLNDGSSYDVLKPWMCAIGSSTLSVYAGPRDTDSEFFDEPVIIANRAITKLEPLVDEMAT